MFNVTEKAQKEIAAYFKDKEPSPVRVFLHQGGCGGPQIVMALDQKQATDATYEFAGVTYLIESEFLEKAQPIEVDFLETGFKITSSLQLGGGCSSCGTKGSCCS